MSRTETGDLETRLTSTAEGLLAWQQEKLIFGVTERICELMDEQGVSRADLARQLGTTKSYVTQILDGTRNMTLRSVASIFTLLGHELTPDSLPLGSNAVSVAVHIPEESYDFDTDIQWNVKLDAR